MVSNYPHCLFMLATTFLITAVLCDKKKFLPIFYSSRTGSMFLSQFKTQVPKEIYEFVFAAPSLGLSPNNTAVHDESGGTKFLIKFKDTSAWWSQQDPVNAPPLHPFWAFHVAFYFFWEPSFLFTN